MRDFKLDETGDIMLDGNDAVTTADDDEIMQRVIMTLQTRLGEFEPETETGLEDENIFGKHVKSEYLEQDIRDAITDQVPDVVEIVSIEIGSPDDSRDLSIKLTLKTVNGTEIQPEVPIQFDQGGD
ncbi:hypothetical protein [Lentilactobacillus parabuchneri]|uniref:hypothetical protein n=1 Tax=Lentilactobacillus parabuchneri TaxID=152331 RepID=UPI002307591C|nr:hypothetical protein [Lentilactobacillus parabuchneri]MDB1104640.1 hypothetical protein [Lentilactobacillus parabuchneri]